jgi:hypothetical protein
MSAANARLAPAGAHTSEGARRLTVNVLAWTGSVLLVGSGVIHFYLWNSQGYKNIPTIGVLFLAQSIACAVMATAIAVWRKLALVAAGTGMLVSSIGGLLISIWWGLFGWQESLDAPYVGMALWVEALGAAALGAATLLLGVPWLSKLLAARSSKG